MGNLKKAQRYLLSAAAACICIRIIWWVVAPLVPILAGAIIGIAVLGWIINIAVGRRTGL